MANECVNPIYSNPDIAGIGVSRCPTCLTELTMKLDHHLSTTLLLAFLSPSSPNPTPRNSCPHFPLSLFILLYRLVSTVQNHCTLNCARIACIYLLPRLRLPFSVRTTALYCTVVTPTSTQPCAFFMGYILNLDFQNILLFLLSDRSNSRIVSCVAKKRHLRSV
jgi:hypothetical protein